MRGAVKQIIENRESGEAIVVEMPVDFFGVKYYVAKNCAVRLCVRQLRRQEQFGSEHLKDEDLVPQNYLEATDPPGVWVVASGSYDPTHRVHLEIPDGWERVGQWAYKQDRYLEKPVQVRHYRPGTTGGPEKKDAGDRQSITHKLTGKPP